MGWKNSSFIIYEFAEMLQGTLWTPARAPAKRASTLGAVEESYCWQKLCFLDNKHFQERQANSPEAWICKGNLHFSTDMIPMEYSLVKPQDCKNPVGTQQNKHQPKTHLSGL